MGEQIFDDLEKKMEQTINALLKELSKIRTGRASLGILEGIKVEYYGTLTPLNQVAHLSIPDSQLISIQPWDISQMAVIEKAILTSDLGLNPSNDGKIIRLPIPALNEERRKEMVKIAKHVGEEYKIALRNSRREAIDMVKHKEKEKKISVDDSFSFQDKIQKSTDKFISRCNEILEKKEKEIFTR